MPLGKVWTPLRETHTSLLCRYVKATDSMGRWNRAPANHSFDEPHYYGTGIVNPFAEPTDLPVMVRDDAHLIHTKRARQTAPYSSMSR